MIDEASYVFRRNLYEKLKSKIFGKIFCRVVNEDELFIHISRNDGTNFRMFIPNLSSRIWSGYSTDDAMYEVLTEYKKHVMRQHFKM